jgi:hypothetical protein
MSTKMTELGARACAIVLVIEANNRKNMLMESIILTKRPVMSAFLPQKGQSSIRTCNQQKKEKGTGFTAKVGHKVNRTVYNQRVRDLIWQVDYH